MIKCEHCGKNINLKEGYYVNDYCDTYFCMECGDMHLSYSSDIEAYVEDDVECYGDDSLSDVTTYTQEFGEYLLEDELNDSFSFVTIETCKGIEFEVYMDDYGQSYFLAWVDPRTNEVCQYGCGTYGDYRVEMEDIADYMLGVKLWQ